MGKHVPVLSPANGALPCLCEQAFRPAHHAARHLDLLDGCDGTANTREGDVGGFFPEAPFETRLARAFFREDLSNDFVLDTHRTHCHRLGLNTKPTGDTEEARSTVIAVTSVFDEGANIGSEGCSGHVSPTLFRGEMIPTPKAGSWDHLLTLQNRGVRR